MVSRTVNKIVFRQDIFRLIDKFGYTDFLHSKVGLNDRTFLPEIVSLEALLFLPNSSQIAPVN